MKKIKFAAILAVVMSAVLCFPGCTGNKNTIEIGTGNHQGSYYSYAENIKKLSEDAVDLKITMTSGSAANVRLLQKGFLGAAIVQNDILYAAAEKKGVFEDSDIVETLDFKAVAGLYTESVQIVVRDESDIFSVDDLAKKRVSVCEEESGAIQNAEQILSAFGISFDDIEKYNLSFEESADALEKGEIDAFFVTAGAPTDAVSMLASKVPVRVLSLSEYEIDKIRNKYPFYLNVTIPKGTYEGMEEDIQTVGVRAVLVVSNKQNKETVKKLTEIILLHSAELNEAIVTDEGYDAPEATSYIPISFHPGAAEYYESVGLSVNFEDEKSSGFVFGSQDW